MCDLLTTMVGLLMIHVIKQNYSTCILIINSPLSIGMQNRKRFFKGLLTDTNNKVQYYYYCGKPIEQMLHIRLHTECSSLIFYLHQRYLVLSPNCVCDPIENNKHYLLDCH